MNPKTELATLTRDCEAIQIPYGQKWELKKGEQVRITQSLGGKFTVVTDQGAMVSIDGKDADAIGKEVEKAQEPEAHEEGPVDEQALEKRIWDEMKTCFDPEIPVNIVELGLIYVCKLDKMQDGTFKVEIKMTLTAPGCGMGEVLKQDVMNKVSRLRGVSEANVELVWSPQWNPNMMSDAAKLQLGIM